MTPREKLKNIEQALSAAFQAQAAPRPGKAWKITLMSRLRAEARKGVESPGLVAGPAWRPRLAWALGLAVVLGIWALHSVRHQGIPEAGLAKAMDSAPSWRLTADEIREADLERRLGSLDLPEPGTSAWAMEKEEIKAGPEKSFTELADEVARQRRQEQRLALCLSLCLEEKNNCCQTLIF
jgi:hypothetical protein